PISLGMLGLKRSTESTTPTGKLTEFKDNVATVEMSYNSSSENSAYWYEVLNLPAYDENGNEYYYWVDEDEVSAMGYTVSYQFKDSNDDTTHCIQGNGEITIINTREEAPSVTLPSTGGTGTTWYYITGMALMLIPIVILARRRKKTT
ncbi:MAG: LPXTG cell wall anchor domain-containing protein, partial [Ruminococcus sp.]|nr:LPXTG cell wall anchor domain-containing protein [Ruminococcus sp.]